MHHISVEQRDKTEIWVLRPAGVKEQKQQCRFTANDIWHTVHLFAQLDVADLAYGRQWESLKKQGTSHCI